MSQTTGCRNESKFKGFPKRTMILTTTRLEVSSQRKPAEVPKGMNGISGWQHTHFTPILTKPHDEVLWLAVSGSPEPMTWIS